MAGCRDYDAEVTLTNKLKDVLRTLLPVLGIKLGLTVAFGSNLCKHPESVIYLFRIFILKKD